MQKVFISYSRKDLAFVEQLAGDLRLAGLEPWYDLAGLDGGTRWGREIQSAIQACDSFIVVLSPHSVDSEWVEKEFMYASSLKRKIIPLLLEPCEAPLYSINLHFIDMQALSYAASLPFLLRLLGAYAAVPPPPPAEQAEAPNLVAPVARKRPSRKVITAFMLLVLLGLLAGIAVVFWTLLGPGIGSVFTEIGSDLEGGVPAISTTAAPGIGSTQTRAKDEMVMVYVPAGSFEMGSMDGEADEQPVHTVSLDAFWIDQTEVTNDMFARCVLAGDCDRPWYVGSGLRDSYYGDPLYADYPVMNMKWSDAAAYCAWAGARLPTEAEWEFAARGTDGRVYPWGDASASCTRLNFWGIDNQCVGDTMAAGNYPEGASPYGALDMAGNVWEWVADWYSAYPAESVSNPQGPASGQTRVLRGGSARDDEADARSVNRHWSSPGSAFNRMGFRCAMPGQ